MKQLKLKKGETFEFKGGAAQSKYPWDAILNGELNVLTKGEDFTVETDAMLPKIKTAARRRYKNVRTSRRDAEGNLLTDQIIVQGTPMSDAEKVAEDQRRAEEKAARAAAGETEQTEAQAEEAAA